MSSLHAALIVDADPKGLESLVYGFQGAAWRITACPTPETASLLIKASGAEIVVVASRADHEKMYALLRQIRTKDAFRTLPVLVLGPEELRNPLKAREFGRALPEGTQRGSSKELSQGSSEGNRGEVDLLPLPAFVRDVLTASQLLVAADTTAAQKPEEEPYFATDITTMTTLSLVRTMNGLARSGLLHLERKGRHGEILFHEGELTAAQVGQLQGMAAVQHVLIWNDGALQLHLRPIVRRGQLHQTAQEFLEEFDRFQRDFTHAIKDIGPPATVYCRNESLPLQSASAVPAEVTPVIRLCDGNRTLSDIIDESPFRVLDTVRILGRLVDLGILVRRDPKPLADGKASRTPLDEFWATARIMGPQTPRASQTMARIGETPASVPDSRTTVTQTGRPAEPRSEVAAHHEADGRPRKRTLEVVTPASPAATADPPPAAQPDLPTPPPTQVGRPGTAPSPVAPLAVTPKAAMPGMQTSGSFELGKEARRTQPTMREGVARTSVVVEVARAEAAAAQKSPSIGFSTQATPAPKSPSGGVPIPVAPAPKSPSDGIPVRAAPTGNSSARITGVMQVAPSRKTAQQMPAAARVSIQLDASLTTAQEKATPATKPTGELKIEPSGARMTGEMQVTPSGKSFRTTGRMANPLSSFHIDPSLTAETPVVSGDAKLHPSSNQPAVESSEKRVQTGNFSPIEKDFFAREAELYKEEAAESFADLEEKRAKRDLKNSTGGKGNGPKRK